MKNKKKNMEKRKIIFLDWKNKNEKNLENKVVF